MVDFCNYTADILVGFPLVLNNPTCSKVLVALRFVIFHFLHCHKAGCMNQVHSYICMATQLKSSA